MNTQKNNFPSGGISPTEMDCSEWIDDERMAVKQRLQMLKDGNYSSLGYIKPKHPKLTFMEKLKDFINSFWLIVCCIGVCIAAFLVAVIAWIFATSPIWIICLTLYLIFK